MKRITIILTVLVFSLTACSVLTDLGKELEKYVELPESGLTDADVVDGLKKALAIGADTSVMILNKADGYYKDELVKIILPPNLAEILSKVKDKPMVYNLIEPKINELVLSLNRSAEDAAVTAKPIFVDAITGMSIQDGMGILKGKDNAATTYLHGATYASLLNVFQPNIDVSLSKPLIGQKSTSELYTSFVTTYNTAVRFLPYEKISEEDQDLSAYVTRKALDGLFVKVAVEEKKIRDNPWGYASAIIEKVFGSLK